MADNSVKEVEETLDSLTFEEDDEDDEKLEVDTVDVEGFLQKRHGDNKKAPAAKENFKWSLRYFILKDGTLHLYQNATDVDPKHSHDLAGCELDLAAQKHNNPLSFVLKKDKLYLILAASRQEDYDQWTKLIKDALTKPASKPPKRLKKKSGLGLKTKSAIGEQVISSHIGKSILKESMNEDSWLVMNNIKTFVTKESGEKVAKRMHNDVYILCREGMLPQETFWKSVKDPLWNTFSLLIDSLELSFAFDPNGLAKDVGELCKVFEKLFAPLISRKSMISMKSVFEYFSNPQVWEKLYTDDKYKNEITTTVKTLRKLWNQIKFPQHKA